MEDQELVRSILSRDRKALSYFYRHFTPKLGRYMRTKVGNPHDAEEIVQDTLFGFLEALRDFQGTAKLETFLFAIANHKIIDYYRRKKLRHLVFSQVPQLEDLISPMIGPEQELDAHELRDKLKSVFVRLIPKYRNILQMKYLEDLSVSDIAQQFSWTVKATESLLFRARKAFAKVLTAM